MSYAQDLNVVKEIVIRGNREVTKDAVLATMTTKVGAKYTQDSIDKDKRSLEEMGFFSAVDIRGVPVDSSDKGNNWQVVVDLQEYPKIKEIRVSGNSHIATSEILKKLATGLKPGSVFNARDPRPSARAIEKLYSDRGYFARVVEFGPSVDSPGTINISLVELVVGNVSVQGTKLTKPWVMKRLIKTRSGDVFDSNRWFRDLSRIKDTGWFEPDRIRSIDDTEREEGKIDLIADVVEAKTGTFNIGFQVDPSSSFAGILRYSQNNIGGTGQNVDINYLQSTQGTGPSIDLGYTNPFYDNKDTAVHASIYTHGTIRGQGNLIGSNTSSSDFYYTERRTGVQFGFARPTDEYRTFSLGLRTEAVKTENFHYPTNTTTTTTTTTTNNDYIQQDGQVSVLTAGYTINHRDSAIDPSRGNWLQLKVEPGYAHIDKVGGLTSDENLLGSNAFVKLNAEFRGYYSKGPARDAKNPNAPRNVLAVRARVGTIGGKVPFFEQMFAGGVDSIRGYQEDRFWGKSQALLSVEYRYPIVAKGQSNFAVIGFVDYGGAWGGFREVFGLQQTASFKMHLGYGPGVSFRTPLGNIQLFLGFNDEGKSRTHFLIGNSF